MSDEKTPETPAHQTPRRGPGGGGGPFGGMGMPVEKSLNFGPTARRLIGRLRPEIIPVVFVIVLGVVSVVLAVVGPKVLGMATDLIFEGAISSQLPEGATKEQIIAGLEASGDQQQADLLRNLNLVPGQGIDFAALQVVLGIVLLLYVFSSLFQYLQGYVLNGVTQRTVYRLRSQVEEKIHRLPLSYFDKMPRGAGRRP